MCCHIMHGFLCYHQIVGDMLSPRREEGAISMDLDGSLETGDLRFSSEFYISAPLSFPKV